MLLTTTTCPTTLRSHPPPTSSSRRTAATMRAALGDNRCDDSSKKPDHLKNRKNIFLLLLNETAFWNMNSFMIVEKSEHIDKSTCVSEIVDDSDIRST
jgi:hypothetical protein